MLKYKFCVVQTGPVRLFTPYKRRKRKDTSDGEGSVPRKLKRVMPKDGSNGEDSDAGSYVIHFICFSMVLL